MAPLKIATFRRLWVGLIIFNMGHLIQIHPESFCETSLPDNSVDAV
jgi:hypothetical protein